MGKKQLKSLTIIENYLENIRKMPEHDLPAGMREKLISQLEKIDEQEEEIPADLESGLFPVLNLRIQVKYVLLIFLAGILTGMVMAYNQYLYFLEKILMPLSLDEIILLKNEFINRIVIPTFLMVLLAGIIYILFVFIHRGRIFSLAGYKLTPSLQREQGFGLIEVMISITLLGIIMMGILAYLQYSTVMLIKTREHTLCSKLSQRIFSSLNNIPYPYVFTCDSSIENFGLEGTFGPVTSQITPYPYHNVLQELVNSTKPYRFDKFTVETRFMVRDLSDLDGDGETTDLRYFTDTNSDGIDDFDSSIRYYDQNNDGDYRDIYGSPEITEQPNIHLKEVIVKIYKNDQIIFQETQLISWEKFTGIETRASGAELKLVLTNPGENSVIYALNTHEQQDAFDLTISTSYPPDIAAYRADFMSHLQLTGKTDPSATINWYLQYTTSTKLDTCYADISGDFSFYSFGITDNLVEGMNKIYCKAAKGIYYSPWSETMVMRDINPPIIQNAVPGGTVKTKQPLIQAEIVDGPVTSGREVSGICPEVITFIKDTETVNHSYDAVTGVVKWVDEEGLLPVLSTGVIYTMTLEGGDRAYYKVKSSWTFICDIHDPDNSAPSIAEKTPLGMESSNLPTISCKVFDNQSGINISSVVMKLDDDIVVSTDNIANCYSPISSPEGGYVSYTPSTSLDSGWHTVEVVVSHWADNPFDKKTSTDTWKFQIP